MDINYPFYIMLFTVATVMIVAVYVTRENKERSFREEVRWFFGLEPRDR